MMQYWGRIAGAWLLLIFANRLVKNAEGLVREAATKATDGDAE